jgi:anti-anti-sigma factor
MAAMIAKPPEQDQSAAGELVITRGQLSDSVEIVVVAGELDMATTPTLTETLDSIDLATQSLVLDISQVTFIDSHSVHALLERADADHLALVLPPASIVRHVLGLTNADRVLNLSETLEEAFQRVSSALHHIDVAIDQRPA